MAGWVRAASGTPVYQDESGLVHLVDASGEVQAVKPGEASKLLGDDFSGFKPANADQLNQSRSAAVEKANNERSSTLGAAARHAVIGAAGAVLAPGKLVSSLASSALGVDDPLAKISGRQVYEDASAIGSELTGGELQVGGREAREQVLADEKIHPYASAAGEMAGNVAGSAPLGGGMVALAGRGAAAAGLAGRAAQVAAGVGGSVLEGAGLGADAASEQGWIKNQPVTAEQTLAGIGLGALFGGAGSAAFEGAGPALSKLLGRGAKAEAEGLEGAALRASGELGTPEVDAVPGRALTEANEAVQPAALDVVPESLGSKARKYISGMADDAAVSSIARGQQAALKSLGGGKPPSKDLIKQAGRFLNESGIVGLGSDSAALERATGVNEAAGQKIGAIMKRLDKDAPYVDGRPVIGKLDDLLGNLKDESWSPEAEQIAAYLEKRTDKVRELAGNGILSHSDLHQYRQELDQLSRWSARAPTRTQEAVREARTAVEGELEKAVEAGGQTIGADLGQDYLLAKEQYRFSSWAKNALEHRLAVRDPANRLLSLTDYGTGAAALAATGGHALPALLAAGGNKLLRERGMSTFAYLARRAAGDAVDVTAAPAAAANTARSLQTMVASSEGRMNSGISKFLEQGSEASFGRSRRTASTAVALRAADLGSAQEAYRDHAREVQNIASNPDIAASRLSSITGRTLPLVAPGLHAAMAGVATKAAGYLQQNLPAPPNHPNSITPQLDEPPPVSRSDLHSYASRVEGIEDPMSLLDDLNQGKISPEKVDAIKNVWPTIFSRIQQTVFSTLAQRTKQQGPVPYERRKLLDLALDGNGSLEPSLRPDSLSMMKQAQEWQESQLKEKKPRPSGSAPKMSDQLKTQSDRAASSA